MKAKKLIKLFSEYLGDEAVKGCHISDSILQSSLGGTVGTLHRLMGPSQVPSGFSMRACAIERVNGSKHEFTFYDSDGRAIGLKA